MHGSPIYFSSECYNNWLTFSVLKKNVSELYSVVFFMPNMTVTGPGTRIVINFVKFKSPVAKTD